jgi:hypothetical protein
VQKINVHWRLIYVAAASCRNHAITQRKTMNTGKITFLKSLSKLGIQTDNVLAQPTCLPIQQEVSVPHWFAFGVKNHTSL